MESLKELLARFSGRKAGDPLPVLFVGHGNPMHAIEDNEFSRGWEAIGAALPQPEAILCVSAHWLTKGTMVTAMEQPRTIHDFYGFPPELYSVRYPAPGAPDTAAATAAAITRTVVQHDFSWGLDHGTWSVLRRMFPGAAVPTYQLSIDATQPPEFHYALGEELRQLRRRGVLVVGSGNIVHNLRMMQWDSTTPYDWALEFDHLAAACIRNGDFSRLVAYEALGTAARYSIPTSEHYLPMLYALGAVTEGETPFFFNEGIDAASVSMRSFIFT